MAKVLIGIPTHKGQEYCLDEFLESLKGLKGEADHIIVVNYGEEAYATKIKSKGFNAVVSPEKGNERFEHILNGREYIRQYAIENGYDYLLFVDSDVMLHPETLNGLMSQDKDIITGAYLNAYKLGEETVLAPVIFKDKGNGEAQLYTYRGMFPARIEEIGAAGLGCCLIKTEVLKKIKFRLMPNGAGEDIAFFLDARAQGYTAYAHTGIRLDHKPVKDKKLQEAYKWKTVYADNVMEIDSSKLTRPD